MKKKLLYLSIGLITIINSTNAQNIRCNSMENLERLILADPSLEIRMAKIEKNNQEIISKNANKESIRSLYFFENPLKSLPRYISASVIKIPVVVHILYNSTVQNISDEQIFSQIDALNEDFRRLNSDKINTPYGFETNAADVEINFCMASTDPNGYATSGIIRKFTFENSFSSDDGVKYNSSGGDAAWPSGSYLNIWVCNLGGGLLGYAQFPGGPVSSDGIVINYNSFGRDFSTNAPYNKGRTTTHEVGHWLNLRHIWGDSSCGDDFVSDTPTQQTSNYGCPSFPNLSCYNNLIGDQFMNYMDYTDDACMNMFSIGQKNRMTALFASGGERESLTFSDGCSGIITPVPTVTTLTIGKGTSTMVAPYGTYYMDEKTQFIITKSELIAAGYSLVKNYIESLAFEVYSTSGQEMKEFTIKLGTTSLSSFNSNTFTNNSLMTTVYSTNQSVVEGWNTHTFTTPYNYSGANNLLVEICWNNDNYTSDTRVYCTNLSTNKTIFKQQDDAENEICSTHIGTKGLKRPNVRLTMGATSLEEKNLDITNISEADKIFDLYPNPIKNQLNINYQIKSTNSKVIFSLYNMMGDLINIIKEENVLVGNQSLSLDFSSYDNMSDGIYFISLNINGVVQTKHFILNR